MIKKNPIDLLFTHSKWKTLNSITLIQMLHILKANPNSPIIQMKSLKKFILDSHYEMFKNQPQFIKMNPLQVKLIGQFREKSKKLRTRVCVDLVGLFLQQLQQNLLKQLQMGKQEIFLNNSQLIAVVFLISHVNAWVVLVEVWIKDLIILFQMEFVQKRLILMQEFLIYLFVQKMNVLKMILLLPATLMWHLEVLML